MKLLRNGTGAYLTGDRIADAVVRLGIALSNEQRVDVVEIPYRAPHGGVEQALLTIGWQTQINAETRSDVDDDLVDHSAVQALVARADRLVPRGDTPMSRDEVGHTQGYDGLL